MNTKRKKGREVKNAARRKMLCARRIRFRLGAAVLLATLLTGMLPSGTVLAEETPSVAAEVRWGKGSVEQIAERTFAVTPEEGYRLWRVAPLGEYLDVYPAQVLDNGAYRLAEEVRYLRVFFVSDAEYDALLESAGCEENLKYYWDNPQWFFKFGTKVLSDEEFEEVYGEYYAAQAAKKRQSGARLAARAFGVPASSQTITRPLADAPRVGQILTARAYGRSENNRVEGVDDTWNDYAFTITSGYGAGQTIHLNCSQNGGWFPISNGSLQFKVTAVDEAAHTFRGTVYWTSDDAREQPQQNSFQGSYIPPKGELFLTKVSAHPQLTEKNALYSLQGAEYALYSYAGNADDYLEEKNGSYYFKDGAEETLARAKTLVTQADGTCLTEEAEPGTYFLKETEAPAGYLLSEEVYPLTICAGERAAVTVSEEPRFFKGGFELVKEASVFYEKAFPLDGAEFVIAYFDNCEGDIMGDPKRVWYFRTQTGEDGVCRIRFCIEGLQEAYDENFNFINAEDAFYRVDEEIVLPLGTYCMAELNAPVGYTLTDGVWKTPDGEALPLIEGRLLAAAVLPCEDGLSQPSEQGAFLPTGNSFTVSNTPVRMYSSAVNKADGLRRVVAGGALTVTDTVTLYGIDTEATYVLAAQIKDAETGETLPLENATDETGTKVEHIFTVADFNGHTEQMHLQLQDTAPYAGKTLYVAEELYRKPLLRREAVPQFTSGLIAVDDERVFANIPAEQKEAQRIRIVKKEVPIIPNTKDASKTNYWHVLVTVSALGFFFAFAAFIRKCKKRKCI